MNTITIHPQTIEVPEPLVIHPSVSPKAAVLLMQVADELHRNPAGYNQQKPVHHCGAACCIIGWMEHFSNEAPDWFGEKIGLTKRQHSNIFNYPLWGKFYNRHIRSYEVPASTGIARIEHFLRTGE